MRNLKKIGIFSVPILIFIFSLTTATEEETAPQQTYTPQVIINAPWGNKHGEFGLYDPYRNNPDAYDKGPVQGPSTFTIAPNGNIYIVDTFNHRLQIFTPYGSFISSFSLLERGSGRVEDITVDVNGNVYLLQLGPAYVRKFSPSGKLLNFIQTFNNYENRDDEDIMGMDLRGGPTKIFCNNSGKLFMRYYSEKDRHFKIFQLGTDVAEFSPEQQKATLRTGFVGVNGLLLNQDRIYNITGGKMYQVDNQDKEVKEYKHGANPWLLLGTDATDCIYLHAFDLTKNVQLVRKYDPEGRLITVIELKTTDYAHHNLNKPITVDAEGNVYVFDSTKDGITLTKWSPAGK